MSNELDHLFHRANNCQEKGHNCKSSKQDVKTIYKPDDGIKDIDLKNELFPNYNNLDQPKLCDCVIEFNDDTYIQVEIKCGKMTSSLVKAVVEKLNNCLKVVKSKDIEIKKHLLIFKKFDEQQTRKLFTLNKCKIEGKPIILKEYKNEAIKI
jgi:hypothetical protein